MHVHYGCSIVQQSMCICWVGRRVTAADTWPEELARKTFVAFVFFTAGGVTAEFTQQRTTHSLSRFAAFQLQRLRNIA